MRVDLIGTGMEGRNSLTQEAAEAVRNAGILIGAQRMLDSVPPDGRERFCAYDAAQIAAFLQERDVSRAAVLLSGDVGFFSGAKRLTEALQGYELHLHAGISSLGYFCAELGISWETMHIVSLHGTEQSAAVHVRMHERTFFLLGGQMTAAAVCRRLCSFGLGGVTVHIGERLGYPEERIRSGTAESLCECETDRLAVMIAENPAYLRYLPVCIPDTEFVRGHVPMTKAEVRGISVSSLCIGRDAVCWDVGCGTGSVSVEAALRCPDGHVYAIDRDPEGTALTLANAQKFGCDNIHILQGEAPAVLEELPVPDAVFIGGSGGCLNAIFDMIARKNPGCQIALNAVTLETLSAAQAAFQTRGGRCEITQIAVSPLRKAGNSTMFQAQNPVFLIRGRLQ